MNKKEKRLQKEAHDAITKLINATKTEPESFGRTLLLLQAELAVAVASVAAIGNDKKIGEDTMVQLFAGGLKIYRSQFDMDAQLLRQIERPQ